MPRSFAMIVLRVLPLYNFVLSSTLWRLQLLSQS